MCLANSVHKTQSCAGSSHLHQRENLGREVQSFKLLRVDHSLRKKAWIPAARPAQKQSPSIPVNRICSKIRDVSSNLSQVAVGPTYGGGESLFWTHCTLVGNVVMCCSFIGSWLLYKYIYIYTKNGKKTPTVCVVLVPGTICRDISAYCVFQIIHSRLCWVLSFLLLCFLIGISLLLWKRKVMCKNQAMLYTVIFYLIYLCHSFARRTWRKEIEEWERKKEGWRGRFAQKKNEKVRFPIWLWLESRTGPRLCPDSTEIQRCFRWSWRSILRFGSWNLVKFHDCPKKTFSGASLRLMFLPSSRCALHYWTLFELTALS